MRKIRVKTLVTQLEGAFESVQVFLEEPDDAKLIAAVYDRIDLACEGDDVAATYNKYLYDDHEGLDEIFLEELDLQFTVEMHYLEVGDDLGMANTQK